MVARRAGAQSYAETKETLRSQGRSRHRVARESVKLCAGKAAKRAEKRGNPGNSVLARRTGAQSCPQTDETLHWLRAIICPRQSTSEQRALSNESSIYALFAPGDGGAFDAVAIGICEFRVTDALLGRPGDSYEEDTRPKVSRHRPRGSARRVCVRPPAARDSCGGLGRPLRVRPTVSIAV